MSASSGQQFRRIPVRKRISPDHIDAKDSGFDRVHAPGFRSVRLRPELSEILHPTPSPRLQLPPQPLPPLQLHHVPFRLLPTLPLLHPRYRHSGRHICSRDHLRRLLIGPAQQHRRQVRVQLLLFPVRRTTVLPLRDPVLERVSGSDRMLHNIGSGAVRLPVGILLLNVLSIDVFRWLRYTDDVTSGYSYIADECCTRYFWYSLYAWTVPIIVVSGSTATVLLRVDGWHPLDARPPGCWVMGMSQLMIFALPVCLILAVNVALYVVAACKMCFEPRQTREPSYRNKYKHRCVVCIQLSVVMGMTWMFAMIAGVSQWSFVWYLFMFFDLVQGVVVFVAFVCTKKVWRLFRQKGRVHRASQETIQSEQRKLCHMNGNHNHVSANLGKKRRPDRRKNVLMIETTIWKQ